MLTTFLESLHTPIYAENGEEDMPIGTLLDFVINSKSGKIEAFWVDTFLEGQKILLPKDILQWTTERIKIQDNNDLSDSDKIPKLQKIFESECRIFKAPVFEEGTEKKFGKVSNFAFETKFPQILNIHVKSFFFSFKRRIIPILQISKITEKGIFILNNLQKQKLEEKLQQILPEEEKTTPLPLDCKDK